MEVLIIEDEPAVQTLIKAILEKQGHNAAVANTAASARETLEEENFNSIILDLGLPDGDGFDLCKDIRENNVTTPILILSGESKTDVKIKCLNAGADDYVTKPFDSSELVARLNAVARRSNNVKDDGILSCGELKVNKIDRTLTVNDVDMKLTNNELDLLWYLMEREGRVVERDEISKNLWRIDFVTPSNFINVYISYLRKKISKYSENKYIQTIHSVGFRLADPNKDY